MHSAPPAQLSALCLPYHLAYVPIVTPPLAGEVCYGHGPSKNGSIRNSQDLVHMEEASHPSPGVQGHRKPREIFQKQQKLTLWLPGYDSS